MVVATSTSFDLEAFRRGYEGWDIDALLALYANEVELTQLNRDNPPSAPELEDGHIVRERQVLCQAIRSNTPPARLQRDASGVSAPNRPKRR